MVRIIYIFGYQNSLSMNFLRKFFKRDIATVICPRCLGKGEVDVNDIKRLGRELARVPGPCAYCNEIGKVESHLISKVDVDEAYLTTALSDAERKKVFNGNRKAVKE
jgi:hypothetical protein